MTVTDYQRRLSETAARVVAGHQSLERLLARACRARAARKLKLGAVAHAYPRVIQEIAPRFAELDGYGVFVNVAEYQGINVFFFGHPGTIWCVDPVLEDGGCFADIGANAGVYSLRAAARMGPKGRVIAFEPNPTHADLIEASAAKNGFEQRVSVRRQAAWKSSDARLTFYLSQSSANSGTSSLVDHGVHVSAAKTIEVTTIALDDMVEYEAIKEITLAKIDVERAEGDVLRGMTQLLKAQRVGYLLVEMEGAGEARDILEGFGYTLFRVHEEPRRLVRTEPNPSFGDYLAVAPSKLDRFERIFRPYV